MSSITRGVEVDPRGLRGAKELNGRVDWELGEEGVEEEALLYCWWVKCEVPWYESWTVREHQNQKYAYYGTRQKFR
jgi:hypothetical protein